MKPPEKFIKYLQAHPAVWEALQEEWEPKHGDWAYFQQRPCLVIRAATIGTGGDEYLELDGGDGFLEVQEIDSLTPDELKDFVNWLPTLGQLVRMLEAVAHYDGWNLTTIEARGDSGDSYAFNVRDGPEGSFAIGPAADEPEIACTALWTKVKGWTDG